jgi:hypothetical protein
MSRPCDTEEKWRDERMWIRERMIEIGQKRKIRKWRGREGRKR